MDFFFLSNYGNPGKSPLQLQFTMTALVWLLITIGTTIILANWLKCNCILQALIHRGL